MTIKVDPWLIALDQSEMNEVNLKFSRSKIRKS